MKKYIVGIQVIKVYNIEVKAKNKEDAIKRAYQMSSESIEAEGVVINVETDYANVVEEV